VAVVVIVVLGIFPGPILGYLFNVATYLAPSLAR